MADYTNRWENISSNKNAINNYTDKWFVASDTLVDEKDLSYNPHNKQYTPYAFKYSCDTLTDLIAQKISREKTQDKLLKICDLLMDMHYDIDVANQLDRGTFTQVLGRIIQSILVHTDELNTRALTLTPHKFMGDTEEDRVKLYSKIDPIFYLYKNPNECRDEQQKMVEHLSFLLRQQNKEMFGQNLNGLVYYPIYVALESQTLPYAVKNDVHYRKPMVMSPVQSAFTHYLSGLFQVRNTLMFMDCDSDPSKNIPNVDGKFRNYITTWHKALEPLRELYTIRKDTNYDFTNFSLLLDNVIDNLETYRKQQDTTLQEIKDKFALFEDRSDSKYFGNSIQQTRVVLFEGYQNLMVGMLKARLQQIGLSLSSIQINKDISKYMHDKHMLEFVTPDVDVAPTPPSVPEEEVPVIENNGFFKEEHITALVEGVLRKRDEDTYSEIVRAIETNSISREELFFAFDYVLRVISNHFTITTRGDKEGKEKLYIKVLGEVEKFLLSIKVDHFVMKCLVKFSVVILDYVLIYSIKDDPNLVTVVDGNGTKDPDGIYVPGFKYKRIFCVDILDRAVREKRQDNIPFFTRRNSLAITYDLEAIHDILEDMRLQEGYRDHGSNESTTFQKEVKHRSVEEMLAKPNEVEDKATEEEATTEAEGSKEEEESKKEEFIIPDELLQNPIEDKEAETLIKDNNELIALYKCDVAKSDFMDRLRDYTVCLRADSKDIERSKQAIQSAWNNYSDFGKK